MKDVFEQLILDFHSSNIPSPSPRNFTLPILPPTVRKAFVFVGMRRSGKTWSMYQCMQRLLKKGLDKHRIILLNFEDDRLISMQAKDFQSILDAYYSLYPQHTDNSGLHFFFDEVHEVPGWERFVRRVLDQESISLYLSGSSAKMLSKEIAGALRGRTVVQEIFPFSFSEFLQFHNIDFRGKLTSKQKSVVSYYAKEFLLYGGFPEAVSIDRGFFRNLLQGYIDVVIYRDIVERHKVTNAGAVREMIAFCLQNAASPISINKIYQRFKSQGKTVSKNSLYAFMGYLEDAYCIFSVPIYSHSATRQSVNPKKIYVADQGLITAYTVKPQFEEAARLENAVFCQLRRTSDTIFYYLTRTGKEVDFITVAHDGTIALYQVCVSFTQADTRRRELDALCQAMEELGLREAQVITHDHKESIETTAGIIHCLPVWEWLLQNDISLHR
ncbi:MAG: ATP-binding protein [Deltaproteobacteria bacterium]|nr:ATP-binding protein [Deltaproteobacteria bacterium]